ncbi:hypothetical protein P3771_29565 [Pseudomonas aeruginosa]|nr:hypothetical protein [Pseudomonas aeruginosa]
MSQKTEQDSRPIAEAVDLPEISAEHSTELLTGSAPCAGVSRPLPAAWLGQRGIYRSRLEAVCNGEQLVDPLTLGELIQRAWPSPSTELAERGSQHRFSTTEQTCRHDFSGVWWNDNGETKTGRECRHCGFFVADVIKAQAEQAEAERPEVVGVRYEDGTILSAEDCGTALEVCAKVQTPLMTVAQHERIVGALRAENAKLSEALDRWPLIRDILKLRLAAAQARVAELEKQEPVAWMHDQPNRVDVIHRDVKELLQRVPGSNRGIHRPLDVSEHYTIPLYAAPVAQAQHSVPRAWLDVQAERRRQVEAEGWTPEHDDAHSHGEMAQAAGCYALHAGGIGTDWPGGIRNGSALFWPWDEEWWKPKSARENIVRACALGLAEIERLDRAAASQGGPSDA